MNQFENILSKDLLEHRYILPQQNSFFKNRRNRLTHPYKKSIQQWRYHYFRQIVNRQAAMATVSIISLETIVRQSKNIDKFPVQSSLQSHEKQKAKYKIDILQINSLLNLVQTKKSTFSFSQSSRFTDQLIFLALQSTLILTNRCFFFHLFYFI